ncbi:TVP38/TMEM64 family protein [Metabacillus herbersteinensis]|uniref:TVP38/TMEM64 family membrane protein n=1 Tax=Metabacillus herbersteinensis TaxID=283816 RepID=A0ABV6GME7_9BACI
MNFESLLDSFTIEKLMEFFEQYQSFGPLLGIGLPMLEAFFPFLPLVVFVVANVNSFGLWVGFIFSWIGASLGAIIVFLIIRRLGQERFFKFLRKHETIRKLVTWVERRGFSPLFLLLCFPFTPSAAVNVVAGLSKVSFRQFTLAVLSGKLVMIFVVSFIGQDLGALITKPERSIIAGLIILLLWFVGKRIEKRLNLSMTMKKREQ